VTRVLLDMGLAQSTARHLRARGHDVVHLRDEGLKRLPDDQIVAKAIAEERAIITHDLDFGRIVALSGESVPSILTLRLTDMTPKNVNPALDLAQVSCLGGFMCLSWSQRGSWLGATTQA
jgi:predicted nuclease of predicted toxin-antitoxin system